jgi:hypothetical protein
MSVTPVYSKKEKKPNKKANYDEKKLFVYLVSIYLITNFSISRNGRNTIFIPPTRR